MSDPKQLPEPIDVAKILSDAGFASSECKFMGLDNEIRNQNRPKPNGDVPPRDR